jgi:hypothetical protein
MDPEMDNTRRKHRVTLYRQRMKEQNPEKYEIYLETQRLKMALKRQQIKVGPMINILFI